MAGFGRVLAFVAWSALVAPAAYAYSIVLTPVTILVDVPPGGTSSFSVRLTNEGDPNPDDEGVPFITYAWDYWHGPGGRFFGPPGTTPRSAVGLLEMVPRTTTLPVGSTVELLGTISAPPDASGGYYAMVFAQTAFEEDGLATGTVAQARLGARVLVRIVGTEQERLEVKGAELIAGNPTRPATIAVAVENTGNVHVAAEFKGVLRTPGGEVLRSLSSDIPKWVLPGETVKIEMTQSVTLEVGAYELAGAVLWGKDGAAPLVVPLIVSADARVP